MHYTAGMTRPKILLLPAFLLACSLGAAAAQEELAPTAAGAGANAAATVPAPAPAQPTLEAELRRVGGALRVFVTLPEGMPPFAVSVTVEGEGAQRRAVLALPFEAAPTQRRLTAGDTALDCSVQGTQLALTLPASVGEARGQFWPAVGGWPPGIVLDLMPAKGGREEEGGGAPSLAQPPTIQPPAVQPPTIQPPITQATHKSGPVQAQVVLDPGHGGIDPGMTSPWVREADVNLDVALRTAQALQAHGVAVRLTRTRDMHLHPDKATDLGLRSRMATAGQVSAFVSIHVNSAPSSAAQGIETYYFGQPLPGQGRSLAVRENGGGSVGESLTAGAAASAQNVLGDLLSQAKLSFSRRLAEQIQTELVRATGAVNRGVKTDAFYVIRTPTTPAVLTELGFGSSTVEGPRLAQPAYRQRQADAIAAALLRFLNTP